MVHKGNICSYLFKNVSLSHLKMFLIDFNIKFNLTQFKTGQYIKETFKILSEIAEINV